MQTLNSDTLFVLAIFLELPDLLKFCASSKKINDAVCKKDNIWYYKLNKDFSNWRELKEASGTKIIKHPKTLEPITNMKTPRDVYILLYWYEIFKTLKEKLKIKQDIDEIYFVKELSLGNKAIKVIPPEIGSLSNLQELFLNNNGITIIPPEIGKLSNLQRLSLGNNAITVIPPEIGKLSNLQVLYLSDNAITKIPPEVGSLTNLRHLSLENNKIPKIGMLRKMLKEKIPNLNIYT